MTHVSLLHGDVRSVLAELPDASVRCCVTSPPYWGLRDYGEDGQIGLEATPDAYVSEIVTVFREVRRVLTDDGTLWLNLGDSYAGSWGAQSRPNGNDIGSTLQGGSPLSARQIKAHPKGTHTGSLKNTPGSKAKDLVGIPWMVAFALRSDGWYLRRDIIWAKPNPMPESVRDRPTSSHEYIFLLTKSSSYFYDADAIAEPSSMPLAPPDANGSTLVGTPNGRHTLGDAIPASARRPDKRTDKQRGHSRRHAGFNDRWDAMTKEEQCSGTRNARSVWTIATQPYKGAHFATFPEELPTRCIKAGSAPGDTVLDPFGGSGTTAAVAVGLGRSAVHIDLNSEYIELARQRIGPMFCIDGIPRLPAARVADAASDALAGGG